MIRLILAVAGALSVFLSGGVSAQDYPTRPIRMIVGYGAGGSTDLAARIVAAHMEKTLGQPITVENRPGGNGAVGTRAVFNATPDGYTLDHDLGLDPDRACPGPWTLGFDPLKLTLHRLDARIVLRAVRAARTAPGRRSTSCRLRQGQPEQAGDREFRRLRPSRHRHGAARQRGRRLAVPHRADHRRRRAGAEAALRRRRRPSRTRRRRPLPHIRAGAIRALLVVSTSWPELEKKGVPLRSKKSTASACAISPSLAGPPGLPEPIRQKLEDALKKAMDDPDVLAQLGQASASTSSSRPAADPRGRASRCRPSSASSASSSARSKK